MRRVPLIIWLVLALGLPVIAADIAPSSPLVVTSEQEDSILRYVEDRALLHLTRATFDVADTDSVVDLIAADIIRTRRGVSANEMATLQSDLIAEGSYFIVSLRYLIESGFPAWPTDRPEETYRRDALALLDPLARQLIDRVTSGEDPASVFETAAQVLLWTEGLTGPSEGDVDFGQRDRLVDAAYRQAAVST